MSTQEMSASEKMVSLREKIAEAESELRRLRDQEQGITRVRRSVFDLLSQQQRALISDQIISGKIVIEDDETWPSEIEVTK